MCMKPNKSYLIYCSYILIIPTSTSASKMNLKEGVYFYDFVVLGVCLAIVLGVHRTHDHILELTKKTIIALLIYSIYLLFSLIDSQVSLKFILKDLRPLILITESFIIYKLIILRIDRGYKKKNILQIISIFTYASVIKLCVINYGHDIKDAYYLENKYRYLDAATYLSAIYIIFFFSTKNKLTQLNLKHYSYLALSGSLFCLFIANSRFIILAILVSLILSNLHKLKALICVSFLSVTLFVSFIQYSLFFKSQRVIDALSFGGIIKQLNSRFAPFYREVASFQWYNFIFGKGIGEPFYIPWFAYREGLQTLNANIDSSYFSYYMKFGLFSILLFYPLLSFFMQGKLKSLDKSVIYFLATIFFVSATHYQIYAIGIFLGTTLTTFLSTSEVA